MRSFVVVILYPFLCNTSYFLQIFKNIGIQDLISVGLVETFDVGILCGLARLNVSKAYLVYQTPDFSDIRYKLRTIIHADFLRLSIAVHQMVQYPDYPRTFQAVICLNVQNFPVVIMEAGIRLSIIPDLWIGCSNKRRNVEPI